MNIYDFYITPEEYEIAAKHGISKCTLERRVRLLGWKKERALTEPPQKHINRDYWIKVAQKNGISKKTFLSRVNRSQWSCEKAATYPIKYTAERNRKYSDKIYKSLEMNGISRALFYDRIRKGWTLERASTEHVYTQEDKTKLLLESNKRKLNYFKQMQDRHWSLRESIGRRKYE